VGIGSNLGNRSDNITKALHMLNESEGTHVKATSFIYESEPAHVTDQPLFLNAAVEIETELEPVSLMRQLQSIEDVMGRDRKQIRYGPRLIDLDILLFGDDAFDSQTPALSIPHPNLHVRSFVLQPLCDLAPDLVHPTLNRPLQSIYSEELGIDSSLRRVLPTKHKLMHLGHRTWVMGVINCTPDSFSDGGEFIEKMDALSHARRLVEHGTHILDIGGQSTRPGAAIVTEEEERARVIPVIEAIRKDKYFQHVPISIDTFRGSVAKEAVNMGADIVNDVSGGTLDDTMLPTVAQLGVPYILMHMRGDPGTMQSKKNTAYENIVKDVREELAVQVRMAEEAGIFRYNIIADPGIGFAKTPTQSLRVIRDLHHTVPHDLPILSGPSRKSFIAYALKQRAEEVERERRESLHDGPETEGSSKPEGEQLLDELHQLLHPRIWGTAAAVTASIAAGADIVRVHDVREMREVAIVADGIYRGHFQD